MREVKEAKKEKREGEKEEREEEQGREIWKPPVIYNTSLGDTTMDSS